MKGCATLGCLVDIYLLLLDEEPHDFRGVVEDSKLEGSVVVDGEDGWVGSLDDEERDHVGTIYVYCPMQSSPPTLPSLVEQVLQLLPHYSIELFLSGALGKLIEDG